MNKTWIVAEREFNSRVKKKTFLLSTILFPLVIFGFYGLMIYFSVKGNEDLKIGIADHANLFNGKLDSDKDVNFVFLNDATARSLEEKVAKKEINGYVFVPENYNLLSSTDTLNVIYSKTIGLISQERIGRKINKVIEQKRLLSLNISQSQLDSARRTAAVEFKPLSGETDKNKAGLAYAVGFISGFLIYIILFIYGTMVMRGVTEEKTSRIAEVIVSSVKPFQLMMGKIVGIGAVGLLQFIIWILLGTAAMTLLPLLMAGGDASAMQNVPGGGGMAAQGSGAMAVIFANLSQINWMLLLPCFLFYFLGGYLLYSSLFAAVGSAVNEDPQEAQSLLLPITMPIIFAIVIMTKAVNDPTSGLAVFGSLFPLTSPVVMMARIAHGIPDGVSALELILSMVILIAGFMCTTWLAGKIYRTGILMYGKKPTWKEMVKWAFRKH